MDSRAASSPFSCLLCFTSPSLPCNMDQAIRVMSEPPAMRNDASEMPKPSRISCPMVMETMRMIITAMWAVVLVFLRSSGCMWPVRLTKTGNRPSGLMIANRPTKNFRYKEKSIAAISAIQNQFGPPRAIPVKLRVNLHHAISLLQSNNLTLSGAFQLVPLMNRQKSTYRVVNRYGGHLTRQQSMVVFYVETPSHHPISLQ